VQSTLPIAPAAPEFRSSPLVNTPAPIAGEVASGGPTVTVTAFDIIGDTIFSPDVLQPLIASYVGKDLTLAGLYQAAAELTRFYQSHGYGLARVTLPEQQLNGGHVTLQVIEGHVGKISVESNTRTRSGVILKQGAAVQSGDVYTDAAMDRASLLVNDLPALQAQAVLQPGSDFGTTDIVYKVQEQPEYSGQISLDDYGRADVGRWRLNGEVDVASLTGSGDKLTADVTHTEGNLLNFGSLSYSLPLGPAGGRLNASYNQSYYRVGGPVFTALGLSGSSKNANLGYLYPEIRSHDENLYWGLGFEHEGGKSYSEPVVTTKPKPGTKPPVSTETLISESNLNLLQLTSFYTRSFDDGSSYSLNGSVAGNGRHNDGNRSGAERARVELDGSAMQPFGEHWSFITKGTLVWSPDPLSDTEKYSLGGPDNARGFDSAEVRGDGGWFATAEVQRSFAPDLPFAVGGFVDAGRVTNKRFTTETVSGPRVTQGDAIILSDVGAEIIFQSADKRWESRLEWAFAITGYKPSDGNSGGHLWATFGMNF